MTNSKLISLLKTFDALEWRDFGEYLASPYFNKKKENQVFYQYLKNQVPIFEPQKLDRKRVFKKVYPNKSYNDKALEDLIYNLLKHAEKFILINRLDKEERIKNLLVLEELMKRKLDKHYRTYIKKAHRLINTLEDNSREQFLFEYQLSDLSKRYFISQNQRKYDAILQKDLKELDQFYFFTKLKSTCELLHTQNVFSFKAEIDFIEPIIHYLSEREAVLHPIIFVYLTIYRLLTKVSVDEEFNNLRNLLTLHQETFPDSEKKNLYFLGINFCTLQIQKNNQVYYYVEQCLELYLEGIEHKFLYLDGYLSPWTFKNVVKLGFNLKRYEWTASFIEQYYTHLEIIHQKDAFNYNMADLFYRNKEYGKALNHLVQVEYTDIFYNLGAKAMLIKIYYETNEEEALLSMIASFTIYLKRNKKITTNTKLTYLNFTNFLYKLIKVKPMNLTNLLEEIQQEKLLANRRWLLSLKK